MGTIACMVSDGSDFYLLTNTHLAGQAGRPVRALLRGVPQVVGSTSGYTPPDGTNVFRSLSGSAWQGPVVNIDAALVRLEDAHLWDARTLKKPLGDVADFSADAASLSWIGQLFAAMAPRARKCMDKSKLFSIGTNRSAAATMLPIS